MRRRLLSLLVVVSVTTLALPTAGLAAAALGIAAPKQFTPTGHQQVYKVPSGVQLEGVVAVGGWGGSADPQPPASQHLRPARRCRVICNHAGEDAVCRGGPERHGWRRVDVRRRRRCGRPATWSAGLWHRRHERPVQRPVGGVGRWRQRRAHLLGARREVPRRRHVRRLAADASRRVAAARAARASTATVPAATMVATRAAKGRTSNSHQQARPGLPRSRSRRES